MKGTVLPKLQLALDLTTTADSARILEQVVDQVDIIEVGTVLCLSEGLRSIADLSFMSRGKPIVADIRLGRAGALFANLAFEAGANIVTALGEAPSAVLQAAILSAVQHGGKLEIELQHGCSEQDVQDIAELSPTGIIVHNAAGSDHRTDPWVRDALDLLSSQAFGWSGEISLAGSLTPENIAELSSNWRIDTLVVGSQVTNAANPLEVIIEIRRAFGARGE